MEIYNVVIPYLIMALICFASFSSVAGSLVIAGCFIMKPPTEQNDRISNLWSAFWTLILGCVVSAVMMWAGSFLLRSL